MGQFSVEIYAHSGSVLSGNQQCTNPDTKTVLVFDGVDIQDLCEIGATCPIPTDDDLVSLIKGRDVVPAHVDLHSGWAAPLCVVRYVPAAE